MTKATFTLLGVGTSSGVPRVGCNCSVCHDLKPNSKNFRQRVAALLEIDGKKLLIDAGPDIRNQLLQNKVERIDALLLTHNHFDHIAGIDDVKWATNYRQESIPIFANRPTTIDLKKRIGYLLEPVAMGVLPPFYLREIKKWEVLEFDHVKIQTLHYSQQNEGHSRPTQVCGFRVGNLAFLTDIKQYDSRLVRALKGVETLIVGAIRDGESVAHFTFDEAHQFSRLVKAKRTVFIHLDHTVDYSLASKRLPPNVELGYDGWKIEIDG